MATITSTTDLLAETVLLDSAPGMEQVQSAKTAHTETETCRYSSKPCSNPRAVKKTGDLHSFCEFHRLMANRNQRRCEQKRRTKRQLEKANQKRSAAQAPVGLNVTHGPFVAMENKYKRRRPYVYTASPTSVDAPSVVVSMPTIDTTTHHETSMKPTSIEPICSRLESALSLEPYAHPVPLHEEDLQYLFMTVVDSTYVHPLNASSAIESNPATFIV